MAVHFQATRGATSSRAKFKPIDNRRKDLALDFDYFKIPTETFELESNYFLFLGDKVHFCAVGSRILILMIRIIVGSDSRSHNGGVDTQLDFNVSNRICKIIKAILYCVRNIMNTKLLCFDIFLISKQLNALSSRIMHVRVFLFSHALHFEKMVIVTRDYSNRLYCFKMHEPMQILN